MSDDQQNFGVGDIQGESAVHKKNAAAEVNRSHEGRSLIVWTIIVLGIALVVRLFIATPYLVKGTSMEETFHDADYLIVDRLSYDFEDPKRGDVIIFHLPQTGETLIKRVIGLPGETVQIRGTQVTVTNREHPRGFTLDEPYITPADEGGPTGQAVTLPPGRYFVMGDNRKVSYDSRSWGTLKRSDIVGRVLVRLFPPNEIGILPGEARYGGS